MVLLQCVVLSRTFETPADTYAELYSASVSCMLPVCVQPGGLVSCMAQLFCSAVFSELIARDLEALELCRLVTVACTMHKRW